MQSFFHNLGVYLSVLLAPAAQAARADLLRFLIIVFVVTALASLLLVPIKPRRPAGGSQGDHYIAWLETRADNLEMCVRWYASNSDDGTEARRLLAQLEHE